MYFNLLIYLHPIFSSTLTYISFCCHRCKITMANRIKSCRHRDCYCKPKKATHSASPPPPAVDLELLQRYVRLRENGKFLNLEINCSDGSTRSVHKYILNSLSVNLGRSIQECKYSYHSNKRTCPLINFQKKFQPTRCY